MESSIPLVWVGLRLLARSRRRSSRTQFGRTLRRMCDQNYTQVSYRVFNIGAANKLPALSRASSACRWRGTTHLRAVDRILEMADELGTGAQALPHLTHRAAVRGALAAYASMMHGPATMMIELILISETRGGWKLLAEYERRLPELGARPHWGQYNMLGGTAPARGALSALGHLAAGLRALQRERRVRLRVHRPDRDLPEVGLE